MMVVSKHKTTTYTRFASILISDIELFMDYVLVIYLQNIHIINIVNKSINQYDLLNSNCPYNLEAAGTK